MAPAIYSLKEDFSKNGDMDGFVYVPSINLYVAKEKKLDGKNWFEAHMGLKGNGERMLTMPEFVEFLKYVKTNNKEIYNNITEVRSPWRAEWIDVDFKTKDSNLYVNSNHIFDENGKIISYKSEVLDKNTLMKEKTPGISIDDFLDSHNTKQGFPSKDVEGGSLYYWSPGKDNNSVARFDAGFGRACLYCNWGPSYGDSGLGVRAAKQRE